MAEALKISYDNKAVIQEKNKYSKLISESSTESIYASYIYLPQSVSIVPDNNYLNIEFEYPVLEAKKNCNTLASKEADSLPCFSMGKQTGKIISVRISFTKLSESNDQIDSAIKSIGQLITSTKKPSLMKNYQIVKTVLENIREKITEKLNNTKKEFAYEGN